VGESFFWYQCTQVFLDKEPLNGCVCVILNNWILFIALKNYTVMCCVTISFVCFRLVSLKLLEICRLNKKCRRQRTSGSL